MLMNCQFIMQFHIDVDIDFDTLQCSYFTRSLVLKLTTSIRSVNVYILNATRERNILVVERIVFKRNKLYPIKQRHK